ncbi:MAG: cupin domain-containing protein [Pirellulales bacterium]
MTSVYTLHSDLDRPLDMPADGTMSRTLHQDERAKVVLFNLCAGQELSEHTASTPAIMHFLAGEAEVTLGPDAVAANAGTWIHMPPQMPHSIRARTPVVMLLTLLKTTAT